MTFAQLVGLSKEVLLNTGADWMTSSSVSREDIETERGRLRVIKILKL